jgi:hypothetical protein
MTVADTQAFSAKKMTMDDFFREMPDREEVPSRACPETGTAGTNVFE